MNLTLSNFTIPQSVYLTAEQRQDLFNACYNAHAQAYNADVTAIIAVLIITVIMFAVLDSSKGEELKEKTPKTYYLLRRVLGFAQILALIGLWFKL